ARTARALRRVPQARSDREARDRVRGRQARPPRTGRPALPARARTAPPARRRTGGERPRPRHRRPRRPAHRPGPAQGPHRRDPRRAPVLTAERDPPVGAASAATGPPRCWARDGWIRVAAEAAPTGEAGGAGVFQALALRLARERKPSRAAS